MVQKGEKFHIDFADKDKVVITNGDGEKYLVFNGQDSMEKFIDMLLGKVDTEDTEKVYTVIDDVYIGDTIECREVTVDDMEVRYYDLDTLISMLDKAREENDWVTPLSYSVEGDEVVFIRNGYDNNEETGEQTETELELKVLYGKEGDSYYESDLGKLYGCVFEDDKKMWVEESVLNDVLGFSAYIGNYTIPQTDTVINALVIDTAMGTASPEFVVDDVEEVESTTEEQPVEESTGESNIIIEDQFGGSSTEEQVDPNAPQYDENGELTNYDESIYEKTGVKVHLSGTPEEQAQQCYNAMCDAYPNIPWTVSSDVVGVEWPEMNLNITREEIDQINSELENAVGGRNVADMDLNELWDLLSNYYDADGSLKKEIGLAFTDKIDYMCQGFGGEMHYVSL